MGTKYVVYWFVHEPFRKKLTRKEFDTKKDAESFANKRLVDCVYTIREVAEGR